jgi:FkbM family methyltransferase
MLAQETTERTFEPPPDTLEVCLEGRTFRVSSAVHGDFWRAMAAGRWEVDTLRLFDEFIDADTVVFDVGAWIGPTTLYAATMAAAVASFEPDPVAFEELRRNVELNRKEPWWERITMANKAVDVVSRTMRLGSQDGFGQSVSSALYCDAVECIEVETVAFDSLADDPRLTGRKAFVKVDIEGGEYELLLQPSRLLARPEAVLCLSLHPRILRRRKRADSSSLPWAIIGRRWSFVRTHWKLFQTLPFQYVYRLDGRPLVLWQQMVRAFVFGKFEREILATHQPRDAA